MTNTSKQNQPQGKYRARVVKIGNRLAFRNRRVCEHCDKFMGKTSKKNAGKPINTAKSNGHYERRIGKWVWIWDHARCWKCRKSDKASKKRRAKETKTAIADAHKSHNAVHALYYSPLSREEALRVGQRSYWAYQRCPNGHGANGGRIERYCSSGRCAECKRGLNNR